MRKITPAQRRKIWATAKERGLDKDAVKEIVFQITGQGSTSDISIADAIKLIDRLEGKTGGSQRTVKSACNQNQITKAQLWKIDQLAKELGWADNPKRVEAFVRKIAKVDKVSWLTKYQAIKVIDGLKTMFKRQQQAI